MLLNVHTTVEQARRDALVRAGAGQRGRDRRRWMRRVAAVVAAVAVGAALGVEPANAQGLPSWLLITDEWVDEGGTMTFDVFISAGGTVPGGFKVTPVITDGSTQHSGYGTAKNGTDYTATANPATLTFKGTANEKHTFTVATTEDSVAEDTEIFTVKLSVTETEARFQIDDSTGYIRDDDSATLTIADASVSEGDGATFTVTLDNAVQGGFTVTPSFTDGTATSGTDYTENTAGISFAGTAGETQTFTVATTEDTDVENDETFTVSLTATGTSTTVTATDTAAGTIVDDDDDQQRSGITPALTIADAEADEGDSITFTVTLDEDVSGGLSVTPSFTDGTAAKGTDYTATATALSFAGTGGETQSFAVATTEDTDVEADETFTVSLRVSGTSETIAASDTATGTIVDDDDAPAVNLAVSPSIVGEGASATRVTVTASLSSNRTFAEDRTVTVSVGGGTATSGTDYAAVSNFDITIAKGAASGTGTFTLRPIQDTTVEGNETIDVAGAAGDLTVNGTRLALTDDNGAPAVNLSVSPSSVGEGASATRVAVTASLSGNRTFTEDRRVTVSVGGGTATPGTDYAAVSNFDITIAKGATSGTGMFTLRPIQDTTVEGNGTIDVAGAAGDLTVNGTWLTLTDDDGTPEVDLSVSPSIVSEGDAPTRVTVTAAFSSSSTLSTDTTVRVSVGGGTATSGTDYAAVSDFDVRIRGGETSGTETFRLTPAADAQVEASETIRVAGGASGLTVNGTRLTLTDSTPRLSVGAARAAEGENMVFTVALQAAGRQAVTVRYATTDGSAAAGADYTSTSGQLVFSADKTEHSVSVPVADDAEVEDNETFVLAVQLADAQGPSASATGTIVDNDVLTVSVTEPDVRETDGVATFTVSPSPPSSYEVVVEYWTSDGTATAGADYVGTAGRLVFAPGETEKVVDVEVLDDDVVESAETLLLTMTVASVGSRASGPSAEAPPIRMAAVGGTDRASPTSLQTTGTIRDDELARTRGSGTSRTLYLLARSMASEAVAAIGERFVATGGDDTPRATLGAAPAGGQGVAGTGAGVAYPAVSSTGGMGASPGAGRGAMALHRASDEPFADLGWLDNANFSVPVGEANRSGRWQVWGRAGTVRSRLQTRTGGHARGDVF